MGVGASLELGPRGKVGRKKVATRLVVHLSLKSSLYKNYINSKVFLNAN